MMTAIKGILLLHQKGDEEAIDEYGFDVVIRTARLPKRKKKTSEKKK